MILEGVVTNVANFGAFVDIGVHQDGLVHVSQLADRFVSDPHAVVKAGDIVKVKVLEVDAERKRIALSHARTSRAPRSVRRTRHSVCGLNARDMVPGASTPSPTRRWTARITRRRIRPR
jgi:protein Tex